MILFEYADDVDKMFSFQCDFDEMFWKVFKIYEDSFFFRKILPKARLQLRHQSGSVTKQYYEWMNMSISYDFYFQLCFVYDRSMFTDRVDQSNFLLMMKTTSFRSISRSNTFFFNTDSVSSMDDGRLAIVDLISRDVQMLHL